MKKDIEHSKMAQTMLNKIPRKVSLACPLIVFINIIVIIVLTKNIAYPNIISVPFNAESSYMTTHNNDKVLLIYIKNNIESDGIKEQNEVNVRFHDINPQEKGVIQGKIIKINSEGTGNKIMIRLSTWPYTTYHETLDNAIVLNGFCDVQTTNTTFFAKLPQLFNLKRSKQ